MTTINKNEILLLKKILPTLCELMIWDETLKKYYAASFTLESYEMNLLKIFLNKINKN